MKKLWHIFKKIMTITAVVSMMALFVVVLTSARQKQNRLVCNQLKVKIDYDSGLAFLTETEIKERVNFLCDSAVTGKPLAEIEFPALERDMVRNPYVDRAEIFVDGQQNLIVDITQKRPILRILNSDGVSYYIGEKNERIPLSDKFTSHVVIATGNVQMHNDARRDSLVQLGLFKLIKYLKKDQFLHALVDQVYVRENAEIDIIPKISGHTIRFGQVGDNMEEKFNRLKVFYKEGMAKVGWSKYKQIDLRFKSQVVCEKRDSTAIVKF